MSILQGQVSQAKVSTINERNKALRFYKQTKDVGLSYKKIVDEVKDITIVGFSDAAWGVREDGASQGGFLIVWAHKRVMDGHPTEMVILDWQSSKLRRIARSSLAAEAQAAATCAEAIEWNKVKSS